MHFGKFKLKGEFVFSEKSTGIFSVLDPLEEFFLIKIVIH